MVWSRNRLNGFEHISALGINRASGQRKKTEVRVMGKEILLNLKLKDYAEN